MANWSKKTAGKESSTEETDLTFEPCIFGKAKVWLPVDLIEDPSVFKSVISQETWDSSLTDEEREKLLKLMPQFPEDDEQEKQETLRCLFERENFKFGNPLTVFEERLRAGFMNPEIIDIERGLRNATYRDYKFSEQRRLHRLLKEVLISRQELLEAAIFTSPSAAVPVKRRLYRNDKAVDAVVDKKYRKMLESSREGDTTPDSSDDGETRPEMNGFHQSPLSLSDLDHLLDPKWTDFWPQDLDQQEEVGTHSTFDPKPVHADGNGTPGKGSSPTKSSAPVRLSQQQYIKLLENYQDRTEDEHLRKHPELNTKHITLTGIIARSFPLPPPPQLPYPGLLLKTEDLDVKTGKKRKDREKDRKKKKKRKMAVMTPTAPPKCATPISTISMEGNSPVDILSTPESRPSTRDDFSTSPATCSPASAGSSVTASSTNDFLTSPSPASSPASPSSPSSDIKPPLRVHPSFFSLIRDIFSAAPSHRLTLAKLRESLANWQRSPVSMLSTWAILQPSWAKVVDGAMRFLSGEVTVSPEVIPRVRYDEDRQMWQWRSELPPDSEEELVTLFKQWLDTLPGMRAVPPKPKEVSNSTTTPLANVTVEESKEEKKEMKPSFAEQERERYSQPHKAFVYKMADYEAIVGPVKGVFGKETTPNKAREHALLISDRPSYVTILSLVRDAVARLPNGEGTRAAVCELLKDSQYLAESSDSQINNVVSGALDRLHYEKDPCIKYDVNRKLWIYLHRDRTKEEFERLHMEQGAEAKARKSIARQNKLLPKMTSGLRDSPISFQASRPGSAMSDTSSENLSIEVCSPKASPGRASSPKASRKSPAFAKVNPVPGFPGVADGGRGDRPRSLGSVSTNSGKQGHTLGQTPFVISPQKVDSLQSALRGLHQSPTAMSAAGGDNLIRAQLLAAKAPEGNLAAFGSQSLTMQHGIQSSSVADILKGTIGTIGSVGDVVSGTSVSGIQDMPKFVKSMSVPCTLPDGKVVMLPPELLMPSGKATKKRARSGSGGRKKGNHVQSTEVAVTASSASELSKLIDQNVVTPSAVTVSQGTSKTSRKSVTPSPTSVTLGTNKLATVSEALAQKRAEAALQSGRQQGRGQSITLPPGALKGQTVKSILASVGIPLSGASVTVSRIDTPGSSTPAKQGSSKAKESRKSPVFSGVNILGSHPAPKGRPSSAPSVSGKKSPITSMHHALSHQTIGLTAVTKGGQIVVQPVALGIERPDSSASPGIGRQSSSPAAQALTLKAIPVSLAKPHALSTSQDSRRLQHQVSSEAGSVVQDEHDGLGKDRLGKGGDTKQHFVAGNAAAALAHAGKMSGGTELKDFASVPLSVLFPGARQGGNQKAGLPLLTSPFLAGGQIPIASITDGKGVVFQMPHGSNIMSLPMSGVPVNPQKAGATSGSPGGQSLSSSAPSTTTSNAHSARRIPQHLPSTGSAAKTSPALPSNIVTATIRSALAAAQSRANPHQGLSTGHLSQLASSQSSSGTMKLDTQSALSKTSHGSPTIPSHLTSTSGGMSSSYNFPSSGARSRMTPSPSESKTSLTASSIASIIANLKQNPMAAISLPSVSSLIPPGNLSRSMSQPSNQPVNSQGFIRAQLKQSASSKAFTQPTASPSQPQSNLSGGVPPTLAKSLSHPSALFSQTSSQGFTQDLSRMQNQSTGTAASLSPAQASRNVLQTGTEGAARATASNLSTMGVLTSRTSPATRSAVHSSASTATLKAVPMQPTSEIPADVKTVPQTKQHPNPGAITTTESHSGCTSTTITPTGNKPLSTGSPRVPTGVKPASSASAGIPTGVTQLSTVNAVKSTESKPVPSASIGMPPGPGRGSAGITKSSSGSNPVSTTSTGTSAGTAHVSSPVTGATTGSNTKVSTGPPQRVIPPFEPRVTRGQAKGKAAKKDDS